MSKGGKVRLGYHTIALIFTDYTTYISVLYTVNKVIILSGTKKCVEKIFL